MVSLAFIQHMQTQFSDFTRNVGKLRLLSEIWQTLCHISDFQQRGNQQRCKLDLHNYRSGSEWAHKHQHGQGQIYNFQSPHF